MTAGFWRTQLASLRIPIAKRSVWGTTNRKLGTENIPAVFCREKAMRDDNPTMSNLERTINRSLLARVKEKVESMEC
jgi:hypothetical protein